MKKNCKFIRSPLHNWSKTTASFNALITSTRRKISAKPTLRHPRNRFITISPKMENAAIQKKLQTELDAFKAVQKDFQKYVMQRQMLDGQLIENKNVLEELNILKNDNSVYKLFGPVLVKQDLDESRQNVAKRIEYINKELKKCQDTITALENKQDKYRENLQKLQQQYQMAAMKQ